MHAWQIQLINFRLAGLAHDEIAQGALDGGADYVLAYFARKILKILQVLDALLGLQVHVGRDHDVCDAEFGDLTGLEIYHLQSGVHSMPNITLTFLFSFLEILRVDILNDEGLQLLLIQY